MADSVAIELARRAAMFRSNGYCETCGKRALLLYVRPVTTPSALRRLQADNAVAVCAMCRTAARNMSIKDWLEISEPGGLPAARALVAERIRTGLPV